MIVHVRIHFLCANDNGRSLPKWYASEEGIVIPIAGSDDCRENPVVKIRMEKGSPSNVNGFEGWRIQNGQGDWLRDLPGSR